MKVPPVGKRIVINIAPLSGNDEVGEPKQDGLATAWITAGGVNPNNAINNDAIITAITIVRRDIIALRRQ